ncbi:MAG TPA: hypothetical protein VFY66_02075 [Anaerolineales bacterium]|nr:hypothetical protein [Anaerolineales bacterium]
MRLQAEQFDDPLCRQLVWRKPEAYYKDGRKIRLATRRERV